MDRNDVIWTLNDLIATCTDGEAGFQACADATGNAHLISFFEDAARRCAEGTAQLQAKIRELGGDPERGGSMLGVVHRGWMNVRSAIVGMDDRAILTECERGEDYAKKAYASALRENLPADVRAVIARQFRVVKQNHEHVREMRDAMA